MAGGLVAFPNLRNAPPHPSPWVPGGSMDPSSQNPFIKASPALPQGRPCLELLCTPCRIGSQAGHTPAHCTVLGGGVTHQLFFEFWPPSQSAASFLDGVTAAFFNNFPSSQFLHLKSCSRGKTFNLRGSQRFKGVGTPPPVSAFPPHGATAFLEAFFYCSLLSPLCVCLSPRVSNSHPPGGPHFSGTKLGVGQGGGEAQT